MLTVSLLSFNLLVVVDAGTDGLIGRIPETPERKTAPAKKPTRTTTIESEFHTRLKPGGTG